MKSIRLSKNNASTTNNGVFQGWGTSLCWWANRIGYSSILTEKAAELFFGDSGLRMNIMRYNIGGGDDPTHTHIKRTDSMVPGWLYYEKDNDKYTYNYTADKNQLNVLKACYDKSGDNAYVEVFSNSPPYFMCKSGCSSGGKNPKKDNLKDDCYDWFAEYLAHVTEYINNTLKIKVSSISPMNEPNTDFWHLNSEKQEGCHFDCGESQNKIILATHKAIRNRGLNEIEIVASDETSTSKAITAYQNYTPEVKDIIDRISTHTYISRRISHLGRLMKSEGRNLWMSETDWGDVAGKNAGEMGAGLWLAKKIIYDINNLSPSAWVLWQVIDSHKSKNGYMGNNDSGIPDTSRGYWGLAFADHDTEEIILTKKYYSFAQFTRYINPGDTLIHCDSKTLAAYNKESKKLVLVLVNDTSRNIIKHVDTGDFRDNGTGEIIRTSGNMSDGENIKSIESITITDGSFEISLIPNSVTTVVIK